MADEYCPECGTKITGTTGFCSECGATTTSLKNKIEETAKANEEEKLTKKLRGNYYNPNKSNIKAILLSILLPFSGNLYLKENILNLILTIISLVIIFYDIFMLLTLSDAYYMSLISMFIFPIWSIISFISLIYIILMHNRYKKYYIDNPSKYSKEGKIQFFNGKTYIIVLIVILFVLFVSLNLIENYGDSPKNYDGPYFTLQYPHALHLDSDKFLSEKEYVVIFDNNHFSKLIIISVFDSTDSLEYYATKDPKDWGIFKNTTLDGNPAIIRKTDVLHNDEIITMKDGKTYDIKFIGDGRQYTDSVLNSFKFK